MNLSSVLFKYLRELVIETRNDSLKPRKWIPLGRLIFYIMFESKLIQTLMEVSLSKELEFDIGKDFNGRNLKNISLLKIVIIPSKLLDKKTLGSRRILVDDYPIFTKEDPIELLESYIANFFTTGVTTFAYYYEELPYHPSDVYSLKTKWKSNSTGDGPFRTVRPLTKISRTFYILRDIMGPKAEVVNSETSRPSEETTPHTRPHGKSHMTKTPFNSISSTFSISSTPL